MRRARHATLTEWRTCFDADESATFFHGPVWAELWQAYSDGAMCPQPTLVEFVDGRSAILGITRVPTRVPGVMRATLSPEGNCGGWVSADALDETHVKALADIVLKARACVWRVGPADTEVMAVAPGGAREEFTHLIDLRDGADAARARWQPQARRAAAHARRQGARVLEGTSRRHWDSYRRLYHATIARWERPLFTYRDSLFSLLADLAGRGVRLWLVEVDGDPCAGAVVLTHHRYATYWHAASVPQRCYGAANLLQWELSGQLADEGVATYDLNGSGPLPGVVRFKESLGAERSRVLAYERRHPMERAARAALLLIGKGQR